jgi:hypothetical protein
LQHSGLTDAAWGRFDREQQILSIAAEMNRARKRILVGDHAGLPLAYERILTLAEMTVDLRPERALRRELLIWRDVVASLYVQAEPSLADHDDAFRALLTLVPAAYAQLPFLLPPPVPAR